MRWRQTLAAMWIATSLGACAGASYEGGNAQLECQDGVDNDGNGLVDCDDTYCAALDICSGPDWPAVVINEFMARNETVIADVDGGYKDWIELYNWSEETVSLVGWGISDTVEDPFRHVLGDLTIAPGDYLILWAHSTPEFADNHVDFKLSRDGEELALTTPDGSQSFELFFGAQATDWSQAQTPDASGYWLNTDQCTPGRTNGE